MHNTTAKKDDVKRGKVVNTRLPAELVEAMRKNRAKVLNPDKRRKSRVNERVEIKDRD